MGMSASQARLIQLEARMSDVEYEGQQINQQRLTLSNKMNEVYSQAMSMEVPTPPSKIDYPANTYTGKNSEGKDVKFKLKDDGSSIVTSGQPGLSIKTSNRSLGTMQDIHYSKVDTGALPQPDDVDLSAYTAVYRKPAETEGEYEYKTAHANEAAPAGYEIDHYVANGTEYASKEELPKNKYSAQQQTKFANYVGIDSSGNKFEIRFTDGKLSSDVLNNIYKEDPNGSVVLSERALDPNFHTESIADARGKYNSEDFNNALKALKNWAEANEGSFDENKYSVIVTTAADGTISFSFVESEQIEKIDAQTTITVLNPAQMADTQLRDKDAEVTYGTDGEITVKLSNGEEVTLFQDDGYDEMAYEAAYVEYERAKIKYDQEQNELNKKTSLFQQQDKKLELKLTRLDTERNALNTEIEAVKKVIQDATEKGFKTFSG